MATKIERVISRRDNKKPITVYALLKLPIGFYEISTLEARGHLKGLDSGICRYLHENWFSRLGLRWLYNIYERSKSFPSFIT